jgi:hypothetical protein
MNVHTLGLACLLSSALAAPVSEQQTQNTPQIQQAPPSDDFTTFPFPADANAPGAPVFDGPQNEEDFEDDGSEQFGPDMMTMGQAEAFSEMVAQVQQQVQMIGKPPPPSSFVISTTQPLSIHQSNTPHQNK